MPGASAEPTASAAAASPLARVGTSCVPSPPDRIEAERGRSRHAVTPRKNAVITISQCPFPGTACEASDPSTALTTPTGAVHTTTCQSIRSLRAYRSVPETALGRMEGSVVPTATNADAPRRRIPGVESTAPPTPKAPDSTPVINPTPSVSASRTRPGCIGPSRLCGGGLGRRGLGRRGRHEARRGDRGLRPALAAHARKLAQEGDGAGIVVAGPAFDGAVLEHLDQDLAADVGANDRQRPVIERADTTGGDVGVLGREVRARLAAFARPRVAFLQRNLVIVTVAHPDLEHAFDVHLHHVLLLEAVLGLEELFEDGIVERLRAEQTDVEHEATRGLACLAHRHHRRDRRLAAHADERQLLGAARHRVGIGHGVGRVRVAAARRGDDLVARTGHARDGLPRCAVTLEVRDQCGVDVAVVEPPEQDRGHEAAVLAPLVKLGVGCPGKDDVLGDAVDLVGPALAGEHVGVDLGFPVAEAGTRPRARRAPSVAVPAAAGAALLLQVERPVDAPLVVVAEHIVGTGHHAARAARAEARRDHLVVEMGPVRGPSLACRRRGCRCDRHRRQTRDGGSLGSILPMPELPEVETYRRLAQRALERTIDEVVAPDAWYLKRGLTGPAAAEALTG